MTEVTILIVDDDDIDIRALKQGLSQGNIPNPIETAFNGREALEILRGTEKRKALSKPYLILLDINMPEIDGFEFLEIIRKDPRLKDAMVYILTTSDSERDRIQAYEYNVAGYLVKSDAGVDSINFVRLIRQILENIKFPTE